MRHPKRLPIDGQAERATANLRLGAAVVLLLAAPWLALTHDALWAWMLAVVAALFALGFLVAYRRGRGRAKSSDDQFLEFGATELVIAEGSKQMAIAWRDIWAVEVDEERLQVCISHEEGSPRRLEPRYGGLGVYGLCEAVTEAWRQGTSSAPGEDGGAADAAAAGPD